MSQSSKPEKVKHPEFPLLPRQKIIKGLLQLNNDDLKTLMRVWISASLHAAALNSKNELKDADIDHHTQRLDNDLKKLPKRSCVVSWLDEYLNSKLDPKQQAQLELSNVLRRPRRIRWSVYELNKVHPEDVTTQGFGGTIKRLSVLLTDSISIYFPTIVYTATAQGLYWIRIAISTGPECVKYPKVYIVYRPSTKFFVMNPVPSNVRPYLFQALCEVFAFDSIEPITLSGPSPADLLDLILNQYAQGFFSKYRFAKAQTGPLQLDDKQTNAASRTRTSKRASSRLVDEEASTKARKRLAALKGFGPSAQPELDKVHIKFKLDEKTGVTISAKKRTTIPFKMGVTFEGANVLEGLKKLASSYTLPSYLSQVHSKGKNSLEVNQLDSDA